jgi:6-phosphogluconate dehydrogenase (decarboxylating)
MGQPASRKVRWIQEEAMQLGLIGLGKMGANMAERLRLGGHQVVGGFNATAAATRSRLSF